MRANGRRQLAGRLDRLEQVLLAQSSAASTPIDFYEGIAEEERGDRLSGTLAGLIRPLGLEQVLDGMRGHGIGEATIETVRTSWAAVQ